MSIELPPLPRTALIFPNGKPERVMGADMVERAVEARERILLARIAELEAENSNLRRHLGVAAKDIWRLANRCEALIKENDNLRDEDNNAD